jgi:hypothetical protein
MMITAQLELLPRESAATKHALIDRGSGNYPLKSHRRPDSNEDEKCVPENDAPWRFLVDDRAGRWARFGRLVDASDEQGLSERAYRQSKYARIPAPRD